MTHENMLARYKILQELGQGAMARVYAARDRETGAVVALKRLDPGLSSTSDPDFAQRFVRHARSARLLSHGNIVRIHDAGEAAGTAYIAMEMLEGESLRDILDGGPIPVARAIRIAHDIACGLAHAHLEGVVHGGLRPSNIIVLRSGAVKITDFGTGQLGQAALRSEARAGSLRYVSPEQLRGDPVDHRSDLFSLGALFYEMLTQRAPFEGTSPKEVMASIVRGEPPLPSELNPHVPRALDRTVLGMLAAQPAARTPGAPIVLEELQRLEEGLGLGASARAGTDEPAASVPPVDTESGPPTPEPKEPRDASGSRSPADPSAAQEFRPITDGEAFDYHRAIALMERESRAQRSARSRPGIFTTLALVLAVLGIGVAGFMYYPSGLSQLGSAASRMQEALATALEAARPAAPPPVAETTKAPAPAPVAETTQTPAPPPVAAATKAPAPPPVADATKATAPPPAPQASPPQVASDGQAEQASSGVSSTAHPMPSKPLATLPAPVAKVESPVARAPAEPAPAPARTAPAREPPRAMLPRAKVPEQQPGGTAQLILAVSPRGDLYINGEHRGTTPPITTFDLAPGMHRIEVRSGSRTYLTYMTVQAGDVRRIRHDFNAKPIRPPG